MSDQHDIFITGWTGYMGSRLIPLLAQRAHRVRALARRGSEKKLPQGCTAVVGDALNATSFVKVIPPSDTFIHLVGVAHPGPGKAEQFKAIDLVSIRAAVAAAAEAGIRHFIYVSVAHPAPDEGLHRRAHGGRSHYSVQRPHGHRPAPVVCPRAGPSLARPFGPDLLAPFQNPCESRFGAAPGPGHLNTDVECAGYGRRKPAGCRETRRGERD